MIATGAVDHAPALAVAEAETGLVRVGGVLLPGFVDLHVHALQSRSAGAPSTAPSRTGSGTARPPWRPGTPTSPSRIASNRALAGDILANGTTSAVYFATIHGEATRLLVDVCIERKQRAVVSKVAMDHPESCPASYRDGSAEEGAAGTVALIEYVAAHPGNHGLVHPAVTPGFLPACIDPLLGRLGSIVRDCECHVQTQCSESDWQHGYAWTHFGRSDAAVLDGWVGGERAC